MAMQYSAGNEVLNLHDLPTSACAKAKHFNSYIHHRWNGVDFSKYILLELSFVRDKIAVSISRTQLKAQADAAMFGGFFGFFAFNHNTAKIGAYFCILTRHCFAAFKGRHFDPSDAPLVLRLVDEAKRYNVPAWPNLIASDIDTDRWRVIFARASVCSMGVIQCDSAYSERANLAPRQLQRRIYKVRHSVGHGAVRSSLVSRYAGVAEAGRGRTRVALPGGGYRA